MSEFHDWYVRNQDAITWFLIGWLMFAGIDSLGRGSYGWALFDFVLVYINYKFSDVRLT